MYNQLYKFDVKAELGDFTLPFGDEEDKKKNKSNDRQINTSQLTSMN
jgi:hypothetical protein